MSVCIATARKLRTMGYLGKYFFLIALHSDFIHIHGCTIVCCMILLLRPPAHVVHSVQLEYILFLKQYLYIPS